MASKAALAAGLGVALAGGLVGAFAVRTGGGGGREAELAAARIEIGSLRKRVDDLEAHPAAGGTVGGREAEEIAELRRRLDRVQGTGAPGGGNAAAAPAVVPPAPVSETPDQKALRETREREGLEALAKGVEALRKSREHVDELEAKIEEVRRQFLDRSLPEDQRILALGKLRFLHDGINAEVVAGVTGFFRETATPATKDALLREIHNAKSPEFSALFLEALRSDPDERVRERAARDIDVYLDDPAVVAALEIARDGDASEKVRGAAARTLESKGKERK